MTSSRRWVATAVLTGVVPVLGVALFAGLMFGVAWGWTVAAVGWLFVVLLQISQLSILAAWLDDFNRIGAFIIAALVSLTLLSQLTDFLSGTLGAKRAGASKQALWGATVGSLLGVFAGLPGMLIGPFVGAAMGELIAEQDLLKAGKVGLATWLGLVAGMAAKIAIGFTMLGVFVLTYFW